MRCFQRQRGLAGGFLWEPNAPASISYDDVDGSVLNTGRGSCNTTIDRYVPGGSRRLNRISTILMKELRVVDGHPMHQHRSRRWVLTALTGAAGGLAGCQCLGAVDCRVDARFLEVDPEPLNDAGTTTDSTGAAGAATDADTPRTPTPTAGGRNTPGRDRWYPPDGEPWTLKLDIKAEYVRTDRGTFDDVSVVVYGDDKQEIASVPVGPVTVDNGFERHHKEMAGGCCPAGDLERFYDRTETVSVDRFPRHVVASATECHADDRLSVSTFEAGGYYDRRYGCGETPGVFED